MYALIPALNTEPEGNTVETKLLDVQGLRTGFPSAGGKMIVPVDGVSFHVGERETLAIVGESGCGKSVTALSVLQLVAKGGGTILGGKILFRGENLLDYSPKQMQRIRGNRISMIFQEPMTSLNPLMKIGDQIREAILLHMQMSEEDASSRTLNLLQMVEIPSAKERMTQFPHELSGGMRQRVMIAMALACDPDLVIADEPTTALDVTIQAQILELLAKLKQEVGMSVILITHDLGVVAEVAQNVLVMYAGTVVEYAGVKDIFQNPLHPYTSGLMRSLPNLENTDGELYIINGTVPNLLELHSGCRFAPRCEMVQDICRQKEPELYEPDGGRKVRCCRYSAEWR